MDFGISLFFFLTEWETETSGICVLFTLITNATDIFFKDCSLLYGPYCVNLERLACQGCGLVNGFSSLGSVASQPHRSFLFLVFPNSSFNLIFVGFCCTKVADVHIIVSFLSLVNTHFPTGEDLSHVTHYVRPRKDKEKSDLDLPLKKPWMCKFLSKEGLPSLLSSPFPLLIDSVPLRESEILDFVFNILWSSFLKCFISCPFGTECST